MQSTLSLLLIEDDVALNEELQIFLADFFDTIHAFFSAEEAYESYERHSYDLVMTDIQLPYQNGLTLVEKVKKKNPAQMVIVISAYKETDYFLKSIDLGIFSFLTKPFDSQLLIQTMIKATSILAAQKKEAQPHSLEEIVLAQGVVFNFTDKSLTIDGTVEPLTSKEELLLLTLAKNVNHFVRNEQLASIIWQIQEVNDSTLRALVKRLRDKLRYEDAIINLKNRGYKLTTRSV